MPENRALVLVTRPEPGLSDTVATFEKAGLQALACPLLQLLACEHPEQARRQLQRMSRWETLIFPSQHAVEQAFALCPDWQISPATQLIAVGQRTAHRLCDHLPAEAENPVLVPEKNNSEGVIELLAGLRRPGRVGLITAAGGRQAIQHWLNQRHTENPESLPEWQQVFVYRRQHAQPDAGCVAKVDAALASGQPVFTLATSVSIVTALLESWPQESLTPLKQQPLVCASRRIALASADAGFEHCLIAEGATAGQLLHAVTQGKP